MNVPLIVTLSAITVSAIYALNNKPLKHEVCQNDYAQMSTVKLQQKVERRSQNDDLPFSMGLELIKRWSHAQ